jgi:hypothetical protein
MTEDPARYAAAERLNKITAQVQGNLDKLISYGTPKTQAGGRGPENLTTVQIEMLADRLEVIDEVLVTMLARYE